MSKRFKNFPAGDRKRPKLDITISDHNFPLSQNLNPTSPEKAPLLTSTLDDDWGDDNEDEVLLLASQACEEAANVSALPDYSYCMQPSNTSTQLYTYDTSNIPKPYERRDDLFIHPSTSKQHYNNSTPHKIPEMSERQDVFKKPIGHIATNTQLNKQALNVESPNFNANCIVQNSTNNTLQGQYLYKQFLGLQKENQKLKTENGRLMDKCLTKDGEVSILRTRLKTSHLQFDNARLDKLKFHEKNQIMWNEKLKVVNEEIQNLRTQLEFKNLEVANVKDRCRMLESNKVKLTSVTLPTSQQVMNYSQKLNSSFQKPRSGKPYTKDMCLQTEKPLRTIKLIIVSNSSPTLLREIPAAIFEATVLKQNLLSFVKTFQDSSDVLETNNVLENNCRKVSISNVQGDDNLKITLIQSELSELLRLTDDQLKDAVYVDKCMNVGLVCVKFLKRTLQELEDLSRKTNAKFKREMDKRYVEDYTSYLGHISITDLFKGSPILEDEQAIDTRRMIATVAVLCKMCPQLATHITGACGSDKSHPRTSREAQTVPGSVYLDLLSKICSLIGVISCTKWFTGFLISVLYLIEILAGKKDFMTPECYEKSYYITRSVIKSRPLTQVILYAVRTVKALSSEKSFLYLICCGMESGNLKLDIEQGILLFNEESCFLQIFMSQLQVALTVLDRADDVESVLHNTHNILELYWNAIALNLPWCFSHLPHRCLCSLRLAQTIILCLRICATMYKEKIFEIRASCASNLKCVMRTGLLICNNWINRDAEFTSQLAEYEGQYQLFIELCDQMRDQIIADEIQENVLSDLLANLQPNCEDDHPVAVQLNNLWEETYSKFSITD